MDCSNDLVQRIRLRDRFLVAFRAHPPEVAAEELQQLEEVDSAIVDVRCLTEIRQSILSKRKYFHL